MGGGRSNSARETGHFRPVDPGVALEGDILGAMECDCIFHRSYLAQSTPRVLADRYVLDLTGAIRVNYESSIYWVLVYENAISYF